jgi:Collagen triple helix repeat (20 copies)
MNKSYQLPLQVIEGPPGKNGRPGMTGRPGPQGKQGTVGNPGKDGLDGKDGRNGIDGISKTIVDLTALEQAKKELDERIQVLNSQLSKLAKKRPESLGYIGGGGDPNPVKELTITFDNAGSALPTGQVNIFYTIPYDATITGWSITGSPSGSISVDIWKNYQSIPTIANTITGGNYVTLTATQINGSNNLSGWSTSVRSGDIFEFNINSAASLTRACLVLKLLKR